MPCLGPLTAYYPAGEDGSASKAPGRLVFDKRKSHSGIAVKVACGQCIECRLEHGRAWAVRCMNEKRMWPNHGSAFLTLTYDDKHLPKDMSLDVAELQRFMKRLRHVSGPSLRFFACGEYGETFGRPHYHVLLLNYAFEDKKLHSRNRRGESWFTSKALSDLWTLGHSLVGDVTFDSCAYVTSYVAGKITGKMAEAHYGGRKPEFAVMSRRPGIGAGYFEKYGSDVYRSDSVILNGIEGKPPRFYDERLGRIDKARLDELKKKRRRAALLYKADNSSRRRWVREVCKRAKLALKTKEF